MPIRYLLLFVVILRVTIIQLEVLSIAFQKLGYHCHAADMPLRVQVTGRRNVTTVPPA